MVRAYCAQKLYVLRLVTNVWFKSVKQDIYAGAFTKFNVLKVKCNSTSSQMNLRSAWSPLCLWGRHRGLRPAAASPPTALLLHFKCVFDNRGNKELKPHPHIGIDLIPALSKGESDLLQLQTNPSATPRPERQRSVTWRVLGWMLDSEVSCCRTLLSASVNGPVGDVSESRV